MAILFTKIDYYFSKFELYVITEIHNNTMSRRINFSILSSFILLFSCGKTDQGTELDRLKEKQKQEQLAHLSNDVFLFDEIFGDTLVQVKNGTVTYLTNRQVMMRFEDYFSNVEFIKWEDTKEPTYVLSDDATLAHILVQKHVELIAKGDSTRTTQTIDFAWTEVWRKRNGQWQLYSITSTNK